MDYKSVWIFDPYIDADSVTRILRSVTDVGVQMKIVTDAKAPSRNKNDRIAVLQCACEKLGEIMGNQFAFYAFNGNKYLLHDRILMLSESGCAVYVQWLIVFRINCNVCMETAKVYPTSAHGCRQ